MSLASSLNVGVSALRSYSEGLQVVSNNIANVNTVGYKASHAQYSDTFSNILKPLVPNENNTAVKIAPTQVGGGVQVESIAPVFSQGTIQTTSSNSDLAIAGNGFFRVKNTQTGQAFVTRAGNFRVDADGYMVTQQGFRVQGSIGAKTKVVYDAVNGSYDVKGQQDNVKIAIPSGLRTQDISVNLYAGSAVIGYNAGAPDGSLSATELAVLKVGMPISGGSLPSGTFIKSISNGVVTLSNKATTASGATPTVLSASLLTVDSESLNLTFPPDFARPALVAGQVLSGPGIEPGTTIQSATGNLKFSIPASVSSVTLTGVSTVAEPTPVAGSTVLVVDSIAGLSRGMVVSLSQGVPTGVKVQITDINSSTVPPRITVNQDVSSLTNVSAVASGDRTLEAGTSSFRLTDNSGIQQGMRVSGDGLPSGAYVGSVNQDSTFGDYIVSIVDSDKGRSLAGVTIAIPAAGATTTDVVLSDTTGLRPGDEVMFPEGFNTGPVIITAVNSGTSITVNQVATSAYTGTATAFTPKYVSSSSYSAVSLGFGEQTVVLNKRPNANTFDMATLSVSTEYTPASKVGDLRVSFNEGTDFAFYGTNGVELVGIPLEAARAGGPRIRTFNVGTNGQVNVILSNGQTFSSGAVLLQTFKDPGALIREGDNLFSGIFTAGPYNGAWEEGNITNLTAGTGGLGSINGGALELSNVDIGEEFSTMIITQRAFQAGSRVISTADQMLEEAVNLKR
jgi:flagellar hook protein FlgE